jgi:hypothetical protein
MWIKYSASVPESADSTSDCTPDFDRWADHLAQSAWWRGKPSASASWVKRLKRGGWMNALSGAVICETYPQTNFRPSTGSQVATLASPSRNQAKDKATKTQDTSGLQFSILFGNYDHPACCLKTSLDTSRWGCSMSCPTWIVSVTERRGAFIRRRLAEPLTKGNESSSLAWPTPTAHLEREGAYPAEFNRKTITLTASVQPLEAWPTPTVAEAGKISCNPNFGQRGLSNHPEMVGRIKRSKKTKTKKGDAGPSVQDNRSQQTSQPGLLNADWVEELMGFPTGWTDCER